MTKSAYKFTCLFCPTHFSIETYGDGVCPHCKAEYQCINTPKGIRLSSPTTRSR
jgi:Zn finger protein HypA/HybF involved in hydrogenase expression